MNPSQWSRSAENRTMASRAGSDGPASAEGGAEAGAVSAGGASGAGAPGGAASGGNGAAALAGIAFALQKAQQVGAAASARMEQTAAHGGMHGAYPYSTVSAGQRPGQGSSGQSRQGSGAPPATSAPASGSAGTASPPEQPDPWSGEDTAEFEAWPGEQQDVPAPGASPEPDDTPTQSIPRITGSEGGETS
jgi:hypothetical protein